MDHLPPFRPDASTTVSTPFDIHLQDIIVQDVDNGIFAPTETFVTVLGNLKDGQSATVVVKCFHPYFYLQVPTDWKKHHVQTMMCHLDESYEAIEVSARKKIMGFGPSLTFAKIAFSTVRQMKRFARSFEEPRRHATLTKLFRSAQQAMMEHTKCEPLVITRSMQQDGENFLVPYMHQLDQVLMFCTENNLRMADWMLVQRADLFDPISTTQHHFQTEVKHVRPSEYHGIPPMVIASFDIETYSVSRDFPDSKNPGDKTIQIGVVLGKYGKEERLRVVLCLGDVDPATESGTYFLGFSDEAQLLSAFQQLVVRYDVDVLTGYNIYSFDYFYLLDRAERIRCFSGPQPPDQGTYEKERAKFQQYQRLEKRAEKLEKHDDLSWKALLEDYTEIFDARTYFTDRLPPMPSKTRLVGCYKSAEAFEAANTYFSTFDLASFTFFRCSRIMAEVCEHKVVMLASAAMGQNVLHRFPQTGRVVVDMWLWIKNNKRLSSYKLDFVAKTFLGSQQGKVDLAYSEMFDLFERGNPDDIHRIAAYCVVDCDLPLDLLLKLSILPNATEMARVCHTKYVDLFTGGQQRKVFNQIVNKTKDNWVVNKVPLAKPDSYTGATVLEPTPGFHLLISTLDFASLYPSIIRMENLCFSTWVQPKDHAIVRNQNGLTYKMHEAGGKRHMFVTSQRGILPELEEELLAQRKIAKKAMKAAKHDPFEYAIQNGRQLALKISMNSIYGYCGVTNGYMPCWPIAAVTTTVGRQLIHKTKELVETVYTKANGYDADAKVVYGDTDSVMVDFGIRDNTKRGMKRAFELGEEAAKMVTDHFQQFSEAIILENEKVCWPFMIWETKKRYCSRYYEDPDGKGKIDVKGLELTRRDNCNLLKTLFKKVLDTIMPLEGNALDLKDLESAIAGKLDDCLQNIMHDKVAIEEYVISKSLRKDYKNTNLPHVYLSKQLTHRILNEGLMGYDVPKSGDRIPYVIVQKKKGMKLYECAEHPKYVQEKQLKIDRIYYVRQQLQKPIANLTSYCLPYANDMFEQCIHHLERIQSGNRSLATMFGKRKSTSLAIPKPKGESKPAKKRAVQRVLSHRPKTKPPLKKLKMVPTRASKQTKLKLCHK